MYLKATLAVVAVAICGSLAQAATADQASEEQMMAELKALKAEVAELRAAQDESWMNQRRAEEVKTLVRDVLADADTRAAMLDSAITAGHDGENFFIGTENGEFQLNLAGLFQFRHVSNFQDDTSDDGQTGFELRRAKFQPHGHVTFGGRKIDFFLSLQNDSVTSEPRIEEYYVTSEILPESMPGLMVTAGRFRQPFSVQNLTDAAHQMAVERSLVSEIFRVDRSEGVQVAWQTDMVKLTASVNDGVVDGGATFTGDGTDFALTGRADVLLMGEWGQFADPGVAWSGEPTALQVGAAFHYEVGETGTTALNNNFFMWTADAAFETNGFGILLAGYGRHENDDEAAPAGTEYDDMGMLVEAGYMVIPDQLQPFVRYEAIFIDDDRPITTGNEDTVQLLTFGANWFLDKHNSKLSLDIVYGLDPISSSDLPTSASLAGFGLNSDAAGEDGQVAVRAQYQLKW